MRCHSFFTTTTTFINPFYYKVKGFTAEVKLPNYFLCINCVIYGMTMIEFYISKDILPIKYIIHRRVYMWLTNICYEVIYHFSLTTFVVY